MQHATGFFFVENPQNKTREHQQQQSSQSINMTTFQRLESTNTEASQFTRSTWQDEMDAGDDQLFFVTSYSDFDKLGKFFARMMMSPVPERSMRHGVNCTFTTSSLLTHAHSLTDSLRLSAHGPRGTQATQCINIYRFHPTDGSMVLLNKTGNPCEVMNPAFSRLHPRLGVVCK